MILTLRKSSLAKSCFLNVSSSSQFETKDNLSPFHDGNTKTSEEQHLLWVQERLIKQREKCLASLLSEAGRQLGETERFMSNRMKNRAVGPAAVISLYLPGFRCVSASIFCISLYHHSTLAL